MQFESLIEDINRLLSELPECFAKIKKIRSKTIQELENLIVKVKEQERCKQHGRNTKIANITGSSAAITGTILGTVGFGLSFATFGSSLILTAVGAGIGGAGGMTVAGTNITKYFLNKKIRKEVQAAIDEDRKATEELVRKYTGVQSRVDQVKKLGREKDLMKELMNHPAANALKCAKLLGKDIVFDSISAADSFKGTAKGAKVGLRTVAVGVDAAADTGTSVFRALSTAGRVFHIGGFAVSVLLLPVDFYTLVTNSIKLHKGINDVVEMIEEMIAKLQLPEEDEMADIVEQCLRECLCDVLANTPSKKR